MNSMNRSSRCCPKQNLARSTTASSLTSGRGTALILIRSNPACFAASMPSNTLGKTSRRVTSLNKAGSMVSKLMFKRSKPASLSCRAWLANKTAFVVIATSEIPTTFFSMSTRTDNCERTRGSPPVKRIRSTPSGAKTLTRRVICSKFSRSRCGKNFTDSGMQYWQRILQRSVTLIRKFECNR